MAQFAAAPIPLLLFTMFNPLEQLALGFHLKLVCPIIRVSLNRLHLLINNTTGTKGKEYGVP